MLVNKRLSAPGYRTQTPASNLAKSQIERLTLTLTAEDRQTLMAWQRSTTISAGRARRSRLILLLSDGAMITEAGRLVGLSRRFVSKWAQRFLQDGLAGLAGKPGRGRSRRPSRSDAHSHRWHGEFSSSLTRLSV